MANFSYDVVSELDVSEINNVFDQVKREIATRYDFKNTNSEIDWLNPKKEGFLIISSNELNLDSIVDIIRQKLAKRNLSQNLIDLSHDKIISNLKVSLDIPFKFGLDKDQTKQLNNILRSDFPKIKTQVIAESIRVSSSSKDELSKSINFLRSKDLEYPIQFTNFK